MAAAGAPACFVLSTWIKQILWTSNQTHYSPFICDKMLSTYMRQYKRTKSDVAMPIVLGGTWKKWMNNNVILTMAFSNVSISISSSISFLLAESFICIWCITIISANPWNFVWLSIIMIAFSFFSVSYPFLIIPTNYLKENCVLKCRNRSNICRHLSPNWESTHIRSQSQY